MANRFEKAYPARYISSYVPIPFELLYALGKTYADERKKAEEELTANLRKFGEFQSMSSVDMQNYYNNSVGILNPLINEAAMDPSKFKSQEFRSRLTGAMNSIDYAKLSRYKLNAENFQKRATEIAKLKEAGRYNPEFDDIDMANWDTDKAGMMNDFSPIMYQSIREQVEPYLNNLQDLFLYNKGGYNWMGVSSDMVNRQVGNNWSSILETPIAQAYLKSYMRRGDTPEEAVQRFKMQALNDAQEFTRLKPVADPYALEAYKNEWAMRIAAVKSKSGKNGNGGGATDDGSVLGISDYLSGRALLKRQQTFDTLRSNNASFRQQYDQRMGNYLNEYNKLNNQLMQYQPFAEAMDNAAKVGKLHGLSGEQLNDYAFAAAMLTPGAVPDNIRLQLNTLDNNMRADHSRAVDEAEGRRMAEAMNRRLRTDLSDAASPGKKVNIPEEANPFNFVAYNSHSGVTTYSEGAVHLMWDDALHEMSTPLGAYSGNWQMDKLFDGSGKVSEELGYSVDPKRLLAPRTIVMRNPYIRALADNVVDSSGHKNPNVNADKIENMHLYRGQWMPFADVETSQNLDIEERVARGDFGKPTVSSVEGYIDNGNTRGLVVNVNIPMKTINKVYDTNMWYDNVSNTLRDMNIAISGTPSGSNIKDSVWKDGYITVPMVLSTSADELEATMLNRAWQKDLGTTDTKNAQISQDDYDVEAVMGYTPGMAITQ